MKSSFNIKIYSTPLCVDCKRVKDYLTKKGFDYQEFNVAEDIQAQQEMIQKSGQYAVPIISINDQLILGFDKSKIDKLLENC